MAGKNKEYELSIKIAGTVDKSLTDSLNKAESQTKSTANKVTGAVKSFNTELSKLDGGFSVIMSAGKKCFSAVVKGAEAGAAAIAAITSASISAGSEFESAFTGVRKTVDATEEEYAALKEDIMAMSEQIPSSAADIAGVMEIAGQLGIATDSLTDFTETMINLGESTNMAADEAADSLARFANITNMADYDENGVSNYEKLGSVVVDLGNNFATTESEIVEMAQRIAAAGYTVGLTQPQIMALSTAMSSVGIEAEMGGSAMSKLLKKMQVAVETQSDALEGFANVADMTGSEFTEAFQEDAVAALAAFIEGLNDTDRLGQSAIMTLEDLKLTETRLSDTILRLANAQGEMSQEMIDAAVADGLYEDAAVDAGYSASLMSDAIKLANEAWEDNTALATEAGKRYETFDSKVSVMKNSFQNLGTAIYDSLTRTPALEIVEGLTEKVQDFTETQLPEWIERINEELPNLKKDIKDLWKKGQPLFNGILNTGKWIVKNGDSVLAIIEGIGAATAAYKIATTVGSIATALTSLGAAAGPALAAVTAISAVTTALSAYKSYRQDLVDDSLAEHFGDIALSLSDIERISEEIVRTDNLEKAEEALAAFDEADEIASGLQDYVDDLNKLNWKVSIGLELTDDEKDAYREALESYVTETQEYATQERYAVSLSLSTSDSDVAAAVDGFYADAQDELEELGDAMATLINVSFADGILDPDEINRLANLQQKIAAVQAQIATDDFDVAMSKLGTKYGDATALTAESFASLQDEINEEISTAQDTFLETKARNELALKKTHENGDLTDEQYQQALNDEELAYLSNMSQTTAAAAELQYNTLDSAYGDEIADAIDSVLEKYSGVSESEWASRPTAYYNGIQEDLKDDKDLRTVRDAISSYIEAAEPTTEALREQKESFDELIAQGEKLTESQQTQYDYATTMLDEFEMLQGIVDLDGEGFWKAIGSQIAQGEYSDEYSKFISSGYTPEGLTDGVDIGSGLLNSAAEITAEDVEAAADETVTPAIEGLYAYSQEKLDELFSQGFSTDADVQVSLYAKYHSTIPSLNAGTEIDSNAEGGIVRSKELSWLAENGPEAVIPLDGSSSAQSLWESAGRLMGMQSAVDRYDLSDMGMEYTISFNPTYQFYGGTPSRQDMVDAASISQEEFDSHMEQYFKTHRRMAF